MAKFVSSGAAVEDIENREPDMINSDIAKFMELRGLMENSNKKRQHWVHQTSKLLESNRNIEMNYDKLMIKIFDVDNRISETMKIHAIKKQELEDFQNARTISYHKKWDDCLSETGKYANNFCQWITEYCSNVLMKNIENYDEECKKVHENLVTLKQELNDMRKEYDTDYVEANIDIKDLSNLDTITSDIKSSNNNLTCSIRLKKDSLNKMQKKIEQCKVAVNKCETKENTMF